MSGRAVVTLDTRRLHALQATLEPRAQQILNKVTFDVEADAKERAPVDTGALKNSIHSTLGRLSNIVGTGIEYAIYQEFGTYRMAAHPFLIPALERHRAAFLAAWKQLFKSSF